MNSLHIKTGDTVEVISGKSKGKRGKVAQVAPSEKKVIVEGANVVTKHLKPRGQRQQGGIIKTEGAMYACKVMLVCPKCNKTTRNAHKILDDGTKTRVCKHCNENI